MGKVKNREENVFFLPLRRKMFTTIYHMRKLFSTNWKTVFTPVTNQTKENGETTFPGMVLHPTKHTLKENKRKKEKGKRMLEAGGDIH